MLNNNYQIYTIGMFYTKLLYKNKTVPNFGMFIIPYFTNHFNIIYKISN